MIINAITGLSASFRKKSVILPAFVEAVLADMGDEKPTDIHRHYAYASDWECILDSLEFLVTRPYEPLLLIGKSMGGVKTWWMLKNKWGHLKHRDTKIAVVLLDPHGWQVGDGVVGSYGKRKNLEWDERWNVPNLRADVVYQRNSYPRGAHFVDAGSAPMLTQTKLGKGASHWNITRISKPAGRSAADRIQDAIRWLMTEE